MKNHTLMQTIARANRNFAGKQAGLIVDYIGVFRSLQKALSIYGKPTGGGESPIQDKSALIEHLRILIAEARAYCETHDADLDAILNASPASMERLGALQSAFEAVVSPADTRKGFLQHAHAINRIYKAILPNERAAPIAPEAVLISTLARKIRDEIEGPDVSAIMDEVEALLDRTISAEDYRMASMGNVKRVNLSEVDFDALQAQFNSGKKKTAAERLKALLETRVQQMVKINPSRTDLIEKLKALIDRYNTGSRNVDDWFKDLKEFLSEVQGEEQRAIKEHLSEEELALFDILTKPEPKLTDKEREQVKLASQALLTELKAHKFVLDWWKRQETRADVQSAIATELDKALPETPYDRPIFNQKCERAFEYVFGRFGHG
jgi:type I restriction enzyme R subunit